MKKIIEAAEKVCNARTPFVTIYELDRVLGERKELEQTPITEEWLKAHGFRKIKTGCNIVPYYQKGKYESEGIIMVWIEEKRIHVRYRPLTNKARSYLELRDVLMPYKSLADLYDACELCGIELDFKAMEK